MRDRQPDPPASPLADGGLERCDFCRSPISKERITSEQDDQVYAFCTETCRTAMAAQDRVFTEYRGHRWLRPGVAALDAKLPQGILRNSMVLLSAQPGTREPELHAELVWRALERGEPAIFVSFNEPPIAVIDRFLGLDWNVLPYLEDGQLHILDCFTYRVEDRSRMFDRMNDWNTHIHRIAEDVITAVRDPTNIGELENRLDDCAEALEMIDTGVIVIDSLTEFGSLVQPVRAYNFVKDVRADVCKGRFVTVFAGASFVGDIEQFPHDLQYMVDGIVDLEHNAEIVENTLIKRMRIRKMNGALTYPEWTAYEFTSEEGLVMFDPVAEIENADQSDE